MDIVITGKVDKNHRLVVKLPENVPAGEVEVVIRIPERVAKESSSGTKRLFEKLRGTDVVLELPVPIDEEDMLEPLTDEEFEEFLESLPPMSPSSEVLISEMRGNY